METICRLVRVIQSPHECGHALIVSEGSPGLATKLAQLAAHLCDYSVTRINPSSISNSDKYTLDNFKIDLVHAYTRAGVKVSTVLVLFYFIFVVLLISTSDICSHSCNMTVSDDISYLRRFC
jgi:hypothetical protein